MAVLFAVIYDDQQTARAAYETARSLESTGYMDILERALVTKDGGGSVRIAEVEHPVRRGVIAGGAIGAIAGTLFLVPVIGAGVGAAIGGLVGRSQRSGAREDFDSFTQRVSAQLPEGGGALVLLARSDARDRVVQHLGQHGGSLYSYDIADADLEAIQQEVDRAAGNRDGA